MVLPHGGIQRNIIQMKITLHGSTIVLTHHDQSAAFIQRHDHTHMHVHTHNRKQEESAFVQELRDENKPGTENNKTT